MSDRRQNRIQTWIFTAALALVGLLGSTAFAQGIPEAVRTQPGAISSDDAKQISQYVADNSKNLLSADPQALKKDRDALIEPLGKGDTSASFRIAFDHELIGKIQDMVASKQDLVVINGLILAGSLATDRAIDVIEGKIGAKEAAVRYQAGFALLQVFKASHTGQPATSAPKLTPALKDLEGRIGQEKDARVLDAFIRAGLEAAESGTLRGDAISTVTRGAIQASKGLALPGGRPEAEALLRSAVGVRDVIGDALQKNSQFTAVSAKEAAEMAGVEIARIRKMVQQKQLPPGTDPLREAYAQLASAAQTTIQLAGQVLVTGQAFPINDPSGKPIDLAKDLRQGTTDGDATFSTVDADAIIGPGGILSKPPFEISPDKFK